MVSWMYAASLADTVKGYKKLVIPSLNKRGSREPVLGKSGGSGNYRKSVQIH